MGNLIQIEGGHNLERLSEVVVVSKFGRQKRVGGSFMDREFFDIIHCIFGLSGSMWVCKSTYFFSLNEAASVIGRNQYCRECIDIERCCRYEELLR